MSTVPTNPARAPLAYAAPRQWESILRAEGWHPDADFWMACLVRGAAILIILMLVTLVGVLGVSAAHSVVTFGPKFLVSSEWRPNELVHPKKGPDGKVMMEDGEVVMVTEPPSFGALPVIYGTIVSSVIALIVAVPMSLGAALFLVRIAPRLKIGGPVSFLIEFLAAIPSIAYGLWGLFIFAPFLLEHIETPAMRALLGRIPGLHWMVFEKLTIGSRTIERAIPFTGRDMLCGGVILGIMVLPIITAVSRDVLRAVPREQIEGSLALGATWWQSCREMLRYSRSGLFGAIMLGLARASGETMAVAMVIGNNNQISPSPFAPAQTMSSLLANEFAEASSELHRSALLEVALLLLAMSLLFNIVARYLIVGKNSQSAAAH
jgi:phosphate transport system permease protein